MSASTDCTIILWNLKGEILTKTVTKQNTLHQASVSPCGRFVASSGFTPDVLVWQANFSKSGDFQDLVRAFELKVSLVVHYISYVLDIAYFVSVFPVPFSSMRSVL